MPLHTHRSDVAIRIVDLGKQYSNHTWGLRHASANLHYGRVTAVLGPNGAGKSTLIHMLAKAIQPTEGRIEIIDPAARVGWSSQRTTIDWYLNVINNVQLGARIYGIGRRESAKRTRVILNKLKLDDLATKDVSMLSGGQQQRIQVARTLVADPDIMLLDEPTASLDIEASEAVLGHIRERTRGGALALVSSHDLGLLERYCDDVLFILNGELIAHEPMPTFLKRFAPTDALTLTLDTEVGADILIRLDQFGPAPHEDDAYALTVSLPEGASLGDIVRALEPDVRVMDASRQASSLRNVYLSLATTNGGSA